MDIARLPAPLAVKTHSVPDLVHPKQCVTLRRTSSSSAFEGALSLSLFLFIYKCIPSDPRVLSRRMLLEQRQQQQLQQEQKQQEQQQTAAIAL